jgi:hypothetical protein
MEDNHQVSRKSFRREERRRKQREMGVTGKSALLWQKLRTERAAKLLKNAQGKKKK